MKKILIITFAALACCTNAWSQILVNPAEAADLENGFVRIGEFQSSSRNNVGAAAFLFPKGEKLVTGLHSSISPDEFLGGLKAVNSTYSQLDYNLVSYGWKGSSRGFHTIDVGARVNYGLSVPKEIFQILKTGTAKSPYDLSSLRAFGNLYGEIAYGYALPLNDRFSIGARVKLLAGLHSVDVITRKLELTTNEKQYMFDLDADIDLTNRSKKINADADGFLDYTDFTGKGKLGFPTGGGLALDLGLQWRPFDGFRLSASVIDLGGILWYYGNEGRSTGSYSFEGLKNLSMEELNEEKIMARLNGLGHEVLDVVKPKAVDACYKFKTIPFSARLDADYAMPFWNRLSVNCAGLYTGYSFCMPYWEARGGIALDFPGIAHFGASAGSGACGFVYNVSGSVNFLSFKLYAAYENGIGGVIPYESTPLQANNKNLVIGLVYVIK